MIDHVLVALPSSQKEDIKVKDDVYIISFPLFTGKRSFFLLLLLFNAILLKIWKTANNSGI